MDPSGGVCVTGSVATISSGNDYATVKYDADGNELWTALYGGPGGGADLAQALAVDGAGNVYVTGYSHGAGTSHDYATVKYDAAGNELWAVRYDGPANGTDQASALTVDAAGSVYVAGRSMGVGSWDDYATVKYDADGNELWAARYDGPDLGNDVARSLVADDLGNVYVTGYSEGVGTASDYATVKYDADGNELWVTRYDGPASDDDTPCSIVRGPGGDVHVAGQSGGGATGDDYAVVTYAPDGTELWVARHDGKGNNSERPEDMAADGAGNVYVTGYESRAGGSEQRFLTARYAPDGGRLWTAEYAVGDDNKAHAVAVGPAGNVHVVGGSLGEEGTYYDYLTVKYDPDGNELWTARYTGPGSGTDIAEDIAVDAMGNVFVTGVEDQGLSSGRYATVKYDADGNELWVAHYDGPGSGGDWARRLALDASGNVYVTGESEGAGTETDYATVKYDAAGNELWVARYDGPGSGDDGAEALVVDASGSLCVTGFSAGVGTDADYATVKYDTDGNELWVARYDGPTSGKDEAHDLGLGDGGQVYVTGGSMGTLVEGYATVGYGPDGSELWVARSEGSFYQATARALAVDAAGSVFVTGRGGTLLGYDFSTIKYDAEGNQLWSTRYRGPENVGGGAVALTLDGAGAVYVAGYLWENEGSGHDFATIKYTEAPAAWEAAATVPAGSAVSQGRHVRISLVLNALAFLVLLPLALLLLRRVCRASGWIGRISPSFRSWPATAWRLPTRTGATSAAKAP